MTPDHINSGTAALLSIIVLAVVCAGLALIFYWRKRRSREDKSRDAASPAGGRFELAPRQLIPESKFVEIDGALLHYVQAGKGSDVVLLHGIGASIYTWRLLFPFLQTRHRVTAFDLPGFGLSCKEASRDYGLDAQSVLIKNAIEHLRLKKPALVGSSMGGAIALWMAKLYPDAFPKVLVLGPATDASLVPLPIHRFASFAPLFKRALNRHTMKLILRRVISKSDVITDEVVESYLSPFLDQGDSLRAFWSATSLLGDRRLPGRLQDVRSEVLVIYGELDFMVPRRSIDKLMRTLPNATLITHADAGHHIMEDDPQWVATLIERFFF